MYKKKLLYLILVSSLFFFLLVYYTFPYDMLKENIVYNIQNELNKKNIPLGLNIKNLKPYWLTGVELKNIEIINKFSLNTPFKIDKMTIRISLLPILIGRISINVSVYRKQGDFDAVLTVPLVSLFSGDLSIRKIKFEFNKFSLDDLLDKIIGIIQTGEKQELALVLPILVKTSFGGNLSGLIEYNNKGPAIIDLSLLNGYLNIKNSALNIPLQNFSKANLLLNWNGKEINISNKSELISQNIKIKGEGKIETPDDPKKLWGINLLLNISLSDEVEKDFGFLLPQLLSCPSNAMFAGSMKINLIGYLNDFSCQN